MPDLRSSSIFQLEPPIETVTGPTLQFPEAGRASDSLIDTKLVLEPWNRLPGIMFRSPGDRGKQGPEVTSIVGPQTADDWLNEAESTQAPVIHAVSPLTHLSPQGKQNVEQRLYIRQFHSHTSDT